MTDKGRDAWRDYWRGLGPRPGRPVDIEECKRVAKQINEMQEVKP
jgi:hypothetical protein